MNAPGACQIIYSNQAKVLIQMWLLIIIYASMVY